MEYFATVVMEKQETKALDESAFPVYETFETENQLFYLLQVWIEP